MNQEKFFTELEKLSREAVPANNKADINARAKETRASAEYVLSGMLDRSIDRGFAEKKVSQYFGPDEQAKIVHEDNVSRAIRQLKEMKY